MAGRTKLIVYLCFLIILLSAMAAGDQAIVSNDLVVDGIILPALVILAAVLVDPPDVWEWSQQQRMTRRKHPRVLPVFWKRALRRRMYRHQQTRGFPVQVEDPPSQKQPLKWVPPPRR